MFIKYFFALALFTFSLTALGSESVYGGVNPEEEEKAQKICESNNGEFIGSIALIKIEDGKLHPHGPKEDKVNQNFTLLAQFLAESETQVHHKYGRSENWEWLEARFICYEKEHDALSFILRAISTGGWARSYEVTYDYSGEDVNREDNGQIVVSNMTLSDPQLVGFAVDGLTEKSLDAPFVKAVLGVALDNVPPVSNNKH